MVEAVGAGVTGFKIGEEVYGQAAIKNGSSGSFAEWALARSETIAAKPRTLNHTEAAALPLVGVSALQAIMENFVVSPGKKILIHGGAGGIGSMAIQLAKHPGAYVATAVTGNESNFAKALGAIKSSTTNIKGLRTFSATAVLVGGDTYDR
jgi:NADPH:quinone reductase-like Zn-dependent oxidoreductase